MLKDTTESRYKLDKVDLKTRPNEKESYFIVVKVENHTKLGNIIHIAVRDLKMKNPRSPDGISDKVNHMPFAEEAINKSAVKILKEKVDLPDYEEGYSMWREAFDAGEQVFTPHFIRSVDVTEAILNHDTPRLITHSPDSN